MTIHFKKAMYVAVLVVSFSAHADSFSEFFRAVRGDNPSGVRDLIAKGFDPNTRDEHGQTGLLLALREPSPRVIQVLIDSPKTNIDTLNANDESPLMIAALKGQRDVVTKLLARDPGIVNKTGWTPLHYAATGGHVEIMKQLLDANAFIDAQSPNNTTPLMMAAMYGSTAAVQLLLDAGADVTMKNDQGMTAADFAKRGNRPDAIALLSAAPQPSAAVKRPANGKW